MRRFLLKSLLFLLLLKILDIAFFHTLTRVDRAGPPQDPNLSALYDGTLDAEIVAFGSSRTAMQVDPAAIQRATGLSACNLAMLGSNFDQHFFTLQEYADRYAPPRAVLFEADMESLDEYWGLWFQTEAFRPYIHRSKRAFRLFADTFPHALAYKTLSALVFRNRLLQTIGKIWIPVEREENVTVVRGARLREGSDPNWDPNATWKWNIHITLERRVKFVELAEWARHRDFPVILLAMPRYRQARQIRPELREAALAFYTNLAARYDNIYFADFSNDERLNDNPEYYWDRVHLNAQGARRFSEILGAELTTLIERHEKNSKNEPFPGV